MTEQAPSAMTVVEVGGSPVSAFTFLIGSWDCTARLRSPNGTSTDFHAKWIGHYILDGRAIADEYRMFDSGGKTIVLGTNFRSYDAADKAWNIKWLDGITGKWTDLVSAASGQITFDNGAIRYQFKEPSASHAYTRATYRKLSEGSFTWSAEQSEDELTWMDFMVVKCSRARP